MIIETVDPFNIHIAVPPRTFKILAELVALVTDSQQDTIAKVLQGDSLYLSQKDVDAVLKSMLLTMMPIASAIQNKPPAPATNPLAELQ